MEKSPGKRKLIFRKTRHIRWNYEVSEENFQGNSKMVRYHFVIVGDRNDVILNRILSQLTEVQQGIIPIRTSIGKIQGTKFRYLFVTYDSTVAPKFLKLENIIKFVKRDEKLAERKVGNIEDYVARIYS